MADRRFRRKRPALSKGALAGALAGLAGAWTMNQFQALLSKAMQKQQDNGVQERLKSSRSTPPAAKMAMPPRKSPRGSPAQP